MGADKQGSKGGGSYVGGFLQLFDWNAKSRKKLFSNKSELPERSKQGKKSDANLPMTRLHLMDEDAGAVSSVRGSSDYSCASSVTDDEGYGTRAPSVVARLMGLDSLPTSNSAEPYSSPFFDTQSLQDAHYQRKNLDFHHSHQISHSGNLLNRAEDSVRNSSESKPHKMPNRPIEKFQTEILPPKSAKSIPITHHKLLSPIKNPGFIPTKNAAHIMEAAAKIIDPGPQATKKAKMPLVGSSSAPLKVRDLKEKMEASQKVTSSVPSRVRDVKEKAETALRPSRLVEASRRPVESNAAKYLKGQSLNKSWDGPDTTSFRVLPDVEENSYGLKNKGKSVSLAIQAKVNVQRREGLNSSSGRSLGGQRELSEFKSSQTFKTPPNSQKSMHKKSPTHHSSGVLRQNNQKQNGLVDKEKLPSKSSVSVSQNRKPSSGDSSFGRHKTPSKVAGNSKTGSRKMGLESTGDEKEGGYSSKKNFSRKKRALDGEFHFENNCAVNRAVDFGMIEKYEKPNQSNPLTDRHFRWAEDSRKKGMDVVSFTFTAPMTRSMPGSEPSNQMLHKSNGVSPDYRGKRVLHDSNRSKLSSSLGFNVIGSDALSILLEQKLRELTLGVGSSCGDSAESGSATSSASILQHLAPTASKLQEKLLPHGFHTDRLGSQFDSGFSSHQPLVLRTGFKFQGMDEMDECSSNHIEAKQSLDCRHPSPISILEPSFSTESCNSSDSNESNTTEGSKQWSSSIQAHQDSLGLNSLKKFHSVEAADTESSDSASTSSIETVTRKHTMIVCGTDSMESTKWELKYVKEILLNVELMFRDFALGRTCEIINPNLFEQLENRRGGLVRNGGGASRAQRKGLFDCVGECLDIRCRRYVGGGCKTWEKGVAMVRRKDWLAEEVYKEISGLGRMGDCMVDELVDKDMSSQYGRWIDFEVEDFEIGIEIEGRIFNSLVNEVVADILRQ